MKILLTLSAFSLAKNNERSTGESFGFFFFKASSSINGFSDLNTKPASKRIFFLILDSDARIKFKDKFYLASLVLMSVMNSFLVLMFFLNTPVILLVTVLESVLCIPLVVMH